MAAGTVAAQMRTRRKLSGLTQREVAYLLGSDSPSAVSKHERTGAIPSLPIALGYEIIFGEPISVLFNHVYALIEGAIERRSAELEDRLGKKSAKGERAALTAKKLEFLCTRSNPNNTKRAP